LDVVQYSPAAAYRQLDACDKRGAVKRVSTKKMPSLEPAEEGTARIDCNEMRKTYTREGVVSNETICETTALQH
jgi:hypothetical protein